MPSGDILPYGRQWIDDDDIAAVVECLRGDWLTQGPATEAFERDLTQTIKTDHAVAVSSGTAALHLAALSLGIGPGDVALVPTITFVATANCIRYCGGEVEFVDVDADTGLIDLTDLERKSQALADQGRPPRVILPVDFAGQPAPLPEIRAIANRHGAAVIHDAAHSLGATYTVDGNTHPSADCAHADCAILSFHPVKHIALGEGGAIVTNSNTLAAKLRELRTHGIHRDPARFSHCNPGPWHYEQDSLGYNYRITDIQCALGGSQLRKLDSFIARRREIAAQYDAAFADERLSKFIAPLVTRPNVDHSYHLYVVRVGKDRSLIESAELRRHLYDHLREQGIHSQVHYIPVHTQPYYASTKSNQARFPQSEAYYDGCLSLPMYPKMNDGDVSRVIDSVSHWVDEQMS